MYVFSPRGLVFKARGSLYGTATFVWTLIQTLESYQTTKAFFKADDETLLIYGNGPLSERLYY